MRAISYGNSYEIFDDTLKTYECLPVQNYIVRFSQHKGFYLEKYPDIEIKESKIYGVHLEKIQKVINAFEEFERNLGVILSGDKGIGKSLFAKLLSIEARKRGYPLIVVDRFILGIASYLESIEQKVMILFDEFDKTFDATNDGVPPQSTMLGLFDGISVGKKLFVITCNKLSMLNDYLINRPGRFHYHFRFNYPSPEEITTYLQDKIASKFYDEIPNVVAFSKKVNLNYDCLRTIAFELGKGNDFKDIIKDLNIVNVETVRYCVELNYKNGMKLHSSEVCIDLFEDAVKRVYLYNDRGENIVDVSFIASDSHFDINLGTNVIRADKFSLYYDEGNEDEAKKLKETEPDYISITRVKARDLHYSV